MEIQSSYTRAFDDLCLLLYENIPEYRAAFDQLVNMGLDYELEDRWIELFNLRILIDIIIQENKEDLDVGFMKVLSDLYVAVLTDVISNYDEVDDEVMDNFGKDLLEIPDGIVEQLVSIRGQVSELCSSVVGRLFPERSINAFNGQFEDIDLDLLSLPISDRNFLAVLALRQFPISYSESFESDDVDRIKTLKRNILISNLDYYLEVGNLTEHELSYLKSFGSGDARPIIRKGLMDKGNEVIADLLKYLDEIGLESSKVYVFGEQILGFANKHDYVVLFTIVANSMVDFEEQISCCKRGSKEYILWKNCKILLDSIRANLNTEGKQKKKRRRRR